MEYGEKGLHELIFAEDRVVVIINGRVILRQHESNAMDHKIVSSLSAGSLIGFKEGDDGLTCDSNIWPIVASRVVQYISIKRETF